MYYLGSMASERHHQIRHHLRRAAFLRRSAVIRRAAFKCILTSSWLTLFAVQICSNFQPVPTPDPATVPMVAAGASAFYHHANLDFHGKGKVHVCLDKRYALNPIFLRSSSRQRLAPVFPACRHFHPTNAHPVVALACRLYALRSPPGRLT
jgi:hypothetical protein